MITGIQTMFLLTNTTIFMSFLGFLFILGFVYGIYGHLGSRYLLD